MTEKNKKLISKCDGLELNLTEVIPEGKEIKGIVQIAHGMAEYGERYLPFMEFLAEQGYACVINDHRGHGDSVLVEEDLGYFYDETGEYIVEDFYQVTLYMKEQYPNVPLYVFGHSMGTLVVCCYLQKYDDIPEKVILCGAPCNNPAVGVAIPLAKIIEKKEGKRHRSALIFSLALGVYGKKFPEDGPQGWITSDVEQRNRYGNDQRCGFIFTINGFRNLFLLLKRAFKKTGWQIKNANLPILFIAGEKDPVIGEAKSFSKTVDFMKRRGYTKIQSKLYKDKRHELLNEDIRLQVYKDVLEWIEK